MGKDVRWKSPFCRPFVRGTVNWHIPEDIAALDSAKASPEEIRIPGYRVQLFMGRLDSARALRQTLLEEEEWAWPTYVTPYPPLFAVTLGNFTERSRPCERWTTETPFSHRPRGAPVLASGCRLSGRLGQRLKTPKSGRHTGIEHSRATGGTRSVFGGYICRENQAAQHVWNSEREAASPCGQGAGFFHGSSHAHGPALHGGGHLG